MNQTGKARSSNLNNFTGYIVSACTSQTLLFGYMKSTWLRKGSIFHNKPVEFVGSSQTLVDISEHPIEVEFLI